MISFIAVLILSATYIPKDPTRKKFIRWKDMKTAPEETSGPAAADAGGDGPDTGKEGEGI